MINSSLLCGILFGLGIPGLAGVVEYEFESGTLENGAAIYHSNTASGDAAAGWLHEPDASVTLHQIQGGNGGEKSAILLYSTDAANVRKVFYINDHLDTLVLPNTGGYSVFWELPMTLTLNPGLENTISIKQDGFPGGANFDIITIDLGEDVVAIFPKKESVRKAGPTVQFRNGSMELLRPQGNDYQPDEPLRMDVRGRLMGRPTEAN